MAENRFYVDCREMPASKCSLRLSGTKDEVFQAVVQHAVAQHGYPDTQETREKLRNAIKEESGQAVKQPVGV